MPNLGGWEFVILIGILVLLFGAKRLPDMARSIGQSARVFKGEMKGMKNDDGKAAEQPATPPAQPAPLPPAQTPPAAPSATQSGSPNGSGATAQEPTRAAGQGPAASGQ
jgi:sec-independent protein translocase protein TatA